MPDFNPVWRTFQWDKGILNSRKPRLRFSQRWCRWVMIRTSVRPWELLLGTMLAQTHAKPRLCQPFEEQRAGERDHNEYLKKNHSCSPWEAQVASVVGLLLSSCFCSFFSPCSKNLLKSAGYCEATHKRRQDGGARLLQNSFVTTSVAQTWPKTHSPLG